jgi:hypothetical protein
MYVWVADWCILVCAAILKAPYLESALADIRDVVDIRRVPSSKSHPSRTYSRSPSRRCSSQQARFSVQRNITSGDLWGWDGSTKTWKPRYFTLNRTVNGSMRAHLLTVD